MAFSRQLYDISHKAKEEKRHLPKNCLTLKKFVKVLSKVPPNGERRGQRTEKTTNQSDLYYTITFAPSFKVENSQLNISRIFEDSISDFNHLLDYW